MGSTLNVQDVGVGAALTQRPDRGDGGKENEWKKISIGEDSEDKESEERERQKRKRQNNKITLSLNRKTLQ